MAVDAGVEVGGMIVGVGVGVGLGVRVMVWLASASAVAVARADGLLPPPPPPRPQPLNTIVTIKERAITTSMRRTTGNHRGIH